MNDMVRGYFRGLSSCADTLPDCYQRESAAFKHGWMNGRDDRVGKPRERASVLRARAELIERNTEAA